MKSPPESFSAQGSELTLTPAVPPPDLGMLGSFTLESQRGETFGSEQLRGGIWFGSVVCTQCSLMNPQILERFAEVQHRSRGLGNDFHLVSFSMDPANDTGAAFQELGRTVGASSRAWVFLRGEETALHTVIVDLYGVGSGSDPTSPLLGSISPDHPHVMVLVDQVGHVRGRYDLRQPEVVDQMMTHAGLVANTPFQRAARSR